MTGLLQAGNQLHAFNAFAGEAIEWTREQLTAEE